MSLLIPFADNLWLLNGDPVRFLGIPFSTRMVIIRLASGDLCLHSPVQPTPERVAAVKELGPIAHLVAPNRLHAWRVVPWLQLAPDSAVWASPRAREPELVARPLGSVAPPAWAAEFVQELVAGNLYLDEVVFLHRPSGTLLITDLIQAHETTGDSLPVRMLKRWAGVLPPGGVPPDVRVSFHNRAAARASLERILSWEFDRCVIAHGVCMEHDAHERVRAAFRWLLP